MKKLLTLITVFLLTAFKAQNLKDFSVPKGYIKVAEAKGDLDQDGKDEIVIVFNTDEITERETDNSQAKDYKRVFYILKNENGILKIWKENSTFLFSSGTGFYPPDNILEINIRNNCLIVGQQFFTNSRHTQKYKHTFRFQNGDFYLIGSYDNFADTCDFDFTNEINLSTGKVIVNEEYSSCDDHTKIPENYHKEFTHQSTAPIKMNDFNIGDHKFRIPGSRKDFIF